MTDNTPPVRKTYLQMGEICVTIEDDRLESKARTEMALEALELVIAKTLEARKIRVGDVR